MALNVIRPAMLDIVSRRRSTQPLGRVIVPCNTPMDTNWIESAHNKYELNKNWPWRGHLFFLVRHAESANRQLRQEWGDSGDNLSVPMSSSGEHPAEYLGASGVLSPEWLEGLSRTILRHDGSLAFIVPNNEPTAEVLTVLGDLRHRLVGEQVTFWDCAEALNLRRIDAPLSSHPRFVGRELLLQTIVTVGAHTPEVKGP